jgi:hypothetical protein
VKQYWATSLTKDVDDNVLNGLYEAVRRGEVGWLDFDPKFRLPRLVPGVNLILYHVGGNCYIGNDCNRFPASRPTGDRWGDTERTLDLNDAVVRDIVIEDLVSIVQQGDKVAPHSSIVGVHLDNVHNLTADGLAKVFNGFLKAVQDAQHKGQISITRKVGYIAKNNPKEFMRALTQGLLAALPLYQINENARLTEEQVLDNDSRIAQKIGEEFCIPVFLKTFGSDVAYTIQRDGHSESVYVSKEMTTRMAHKPNISGAAWSVDESSYHPTIFVQGSPVLNLRLPFGYCP